MKVLIVEDDILIRRIAATLLTKLGCHAVTANNGIEALDYVNDKLDMVFMDCQMPVLDGFEATLRWRALERERDATIHIPIIALTAEKGEGEKERCLQAGMDDFVSKPLKIEVLREILNKWTAGKQLSSSEGPQVDSASIDSSQFAHLMKEYQGFESLLRQLALTYSREWPQTIHQLGEEVALEHASNVFQLAHKFKGQAQTLHFAELERLAQQLEDSARGGDISTAPALLQQLQVELEAGTTRLRNLVQHIDELHST